MQRTSESRKKKAKDASELLQHIRRAGEKKDSFLFGMEFFNGFFSQWHEKARIGGHWRSDCCDVTGSHPSVLGQDFHYYLEKSKEEAKSHLEAARVASGWGCVLTFDYHMMGRYGKKFEFSEPGKYLVYNVGEENDQYTEVTWFSERLRSLVEHIKPLNTPLVLRLFHECNGDWFWWGSKCHGGAHSYKKFFRFAVKYIRERTDLALIAWSPNFPFDKEATDYYPGDNVVDVIGLDAYDMGENKGPTWKEFKTSLLAMGEFATKHKKVAALTETGNRKRSPETAPDWWQKLSDVVLSCQCEYPSAHISWVLSWFNAPWNTQDQDMIPHRHSSKLAKDGFRRFASHTGVHLMSGAEPFFAT
eukprot:jgi/Bigna1/141215/aug1.61_g15923